MNRFFLYRDRFMFFNLAALIIVFAAIGCTYNHFLLLSSLGLFLFASALMYISELNVKRVHKRFIDKEFKELFHIKNNKFFIVNSMSKRGDVFYQDKETHHFYRGEIWDFDLNKKK